MHHRPLSLPRAILAYAVFPVLLLGGMFVAWRLLQGGHSVFVAMLVPVLVANGLIWLLEFVQPFNPDWRPRGPSLRLDILYALSTSLLVTPLLKWGMLLLITGLGVTGSGIQVWPSGWPLPLQVALAILAADLAIYLTHRWMHRSHLGWRLHIVHHSTQRMHFWAGSRSHVLNAVLIYTGEVGLLLLLGIGTEALVLFTVFTAINGVLEHANIDLRFGILNRVFSTADVHRVHHSPEFAVGDHNFGTATCIWDQVFGTYLLPEEPVREQGITTHAFPESYWEQLKVPFRLDRFRTSID